MIRAFVCGCAGTTLSADERDFLRDAQPFGVILFKRNITDPAQVCALTGAIRDALGRDDAIVLVDQEGGRVQRLSAPHWRRYPPAAYFAALPRSEQVKAVRLGAALMATDLAAVGIDADCFPVLDVPVEGAHDVIGDRAYSRDIATVAQLGRAAAQGMLQAGVLPIMKHAPGHGRAGADSHLALPVVETSRAILEASDFEPFRRNHDLPAAMTAHVKYTALDDEHPATTSLVIVRDIIRGSIGFEGLLFSDDLSMKALRGSLREKTDFLVAAGVDIALHCNGELAEAVEVAEAAPTVAGQTADRIKAARLAMTADQIEIDLVESNRRLDSILAALGRKGECQAGI